MPERYGILQVGIALFHRNPQYVANGGDTAKEVTEEERIKPGGPGVGNHEDDAAEAQDANDVNEHPFMHREGTLNQDELEDITEREEDAAAHPAKKEVPEYTSRIYNFYLFPNEGAQKDVTLASDTIQFLLENKMDFNKVFSEGVSYTTVSRADELKKKFLEKKAKLGEDEGSSSSTPRKNGDRVKVTRTEDIAFVARAMADLREWIDAETGDDGENGGAINAEDNGENDPNTGVGRRHTEGSSLVLPPCDAFLRRCLYETIEAEYPGLILER